MSKLLDDPKVAALVEKEVARAKKEVTKEHVAAVKSIVLPEEPAQARLIKAVLRELVALLKE